VVKSKTLYAGCDVEGHEGSDGQCYIVDLSRTFPPESPKVTSHLSAGPGSHLLGSVVTVSVPVKDLLLPDKRPLRSDCDAVNSLNLAVLSVGAGPDREGEGRRVRAVRGRVCARNSDGTFDIRLLESDLHNPLSLTGPEMEESEEAAHLQQLPSNMESVCAMPASNGSYVRRVRSEDMTAGRDSGLSIYWRLLRPEFVKHRGRRILNAMRSIQSKRKRGTDASPYFVSAASGAGGGYDDREGGVLLDIVEARATVIGSGHGSSAEQMRQREVHSSCGYNEAELLIQNCRDESLLPDAITMSRSFSSPVHSSSTPRTAWAAAGYAASNVMTRPGLSLARNASTSAVCRRDEFRLTKEMVELTQQQDQRQYPEDFDLDCLPPVPTRLRQISSDAVYENMPQPDAIGAGGELDDGRDQLVPTLTKRMSSTAFEREVHTTCIDADSLLQRFRAITGKEYNPSSPFAMPLSPDALSAFSKSDPDCEARNLEVREATALLVLCIVPALVSIEIVIIGRII
jgi:hypothetical protein